MSDQYLIEVYKIELTPTLKNPNPLKRCSAVFTRTHMILLLHHIVNPVWVAATHKAAWKLVPKSNENSEEEKFKNFRKITDG